jgi:hypothetical protein
VGTSGAGFGGVTDVTFMAIPYQLFTT